jgi:hypothetical protein
MRNFLDRERERHHGEKQKGYKWEKSGLKGEYQVFRDEVA